MMRRGILLSVVLIITAQARAQIRTDSAFDAVTLRGINDVYNLEFENAEKEFTTLERMNPHHPAGPFFMAMVQWWRIMIDIDDESHDREFFDALDRVVDMCDSLLDRDPNDVTAIFFKGGAVGFTGRLKFHRNDYLAAANAGRKALPLVQTASRLDPDNYDVLLGTGMYNYYADVIPEEYPYLKPLLLFIPPGDKKKGLEQLTLASEKGKYASVEATYFLLQIYYYYEHDLGKALALAESLHARFPDNMLFHRYLGRCYVLQFNWQGVKEVFSEIVRRGRAGQRGYNASAEREAEYYLGMVEMNAKRYDEALGHFYRCDELSRPLDRDGPSGFMVMANLKVGMLYDLELKRDLATTQYRKVLAMKEYKDSHAQAEQYLKTPFAQ